MPPMHPHTDPLLAAMQTVCAYYPQPAHIKHTSSSLHHRLILKAPPTCTPVFIVYHYNKDKDVIQEARVEVPVDLIGKYMSRLKNEVMERIARDLELYYEPEFRKDDYVKLPLGDVAVIKRRYLDQYANWRYLPEGYSDYMSSLFLTKVPEEKQDA